MTSIQLLLSIGIPSLLVVLSWINGNSRHDRTDKRIDDLERRIDKRLDDHERRFEAIDRRFDEVERRFDTVLAAVHSDSLEIMRTLTNLHERVAVVETKQAT